MDCEVLDTTGYTVAMSKCRPTHDGTCLDYDVATDAVRDASGHRYLTLPSLTAMMTDLDDYVGDLSDDDDEYGVD